VTCRSPKIVSVLDGTSRELELYRIRQLYSSFWDYLYICRCITARGHGCLEGGGAIILLGVVLGFRRLFRVGPVRYAEEDEPLVIQRNQFNVTGMWQRVERITDSYAQAFGLGLIVFGTVLAAFGDEIAELVLPIAFICTG